MQPTCIDCLRVGVHVCGDVQVLRIRELEALCFAVRLRVFDHAGEFVLQDQARSLGRVAVDVSAFGVRQAVFVVDLVGVARSPGGGWLLLGMSCRDQEEGECETHLEVVAGSFAGGFLF